MERWDRFFEVLVEKDPHGRLRSIHNGIEMYDHAKEWVTHVCMQGSDVRQTVRLREAYGKPIVNDELEYEGNVPNPWGCISAEEEVHRIWSIMLNGGYGGHGETYWNAEDVLWWSKGGVLHGESPDRIRFLRDIIESAPPGGLDPQIGVAGNVFDDRSVDSIYLWFKFSGASVGSDYTLVYLEDYQPVRVALWLDDSTYEIDVIDPWEMTVTPAATHRLTGRPEYLEDDEDATDPTHDVELPGRPRLALRIQRVSA